MHRHSLIERLFHRLEASPRRVVWLLGVSVSVLLVELLVAPIGYAIKGHVPPDYLFTGLVTGLIVASLVLWMANQFLQAVAQKNLQHQLQMQHVIFETTPLGVITLDTALRLTRINPAAQERMHRLGLSPGLTLADWWHADDLPRVREQLEALVRTPGRLILQNQRITGAARQLLWVDLALSTLVRKGGEPEGVLLILTDVSQRHESEQAIQKLAYFDALTGLPNRRLMQDRLEQTLASRQQGLGAAHGALIFIDLDNFKTLNDTLGHQAGDRFLQAVAQALGRCLRQGDTLARLGGDEFVVLLPELGPDPADAALAAARVAKKILACLGPGLEGAPASHAGGASLGVALYRPGGPDCEELLRQADIAMYQAKAAGRHTFRFFEPAMQRAVNERAALQAELHEALPLQQLHCLYQLQHDEAAGPCGAELLLRWQHPRAGTLLPPQFLPLAGQGAQGLAIGQWVLEQACAQLARWRERPALAPLCVAVNVSPAHFAQPDFAEQVLQALARHGAPPARLCLELTESLILQDPEACARKMQALRAQAVRFALDDFGTGLSSLEQLCRLPLDQIKIDRRFVQGLEAQGPERLVVQASIDLARNLGLEVLAEGVETERQRAALRELGCTRLQGHVMDRPLPAPALEARLESGAAGAAAPPH